MAGSIARRRAQVLLLDVQPIRFHLPFSTQLTMATTNTNKTCVVCETTETEAVITSIVVSVGEVDVCMNCIKTEDMATIGAAARGDDGLKAKYAGQAVGVPSDSRDQNHILRLDDDGSARMCSCEAFQYGHGACKHMNRWDDGEYTENEVEVAE